MLALGCSSIALGALPGASSASSSTGTKIVMSKYGFSVTLPSGWQRVTLTNAGIHKIAQYLNRVNPALEQQFVSNAATVRNVQLYAVGPAQASSLPNLNVIVQSPQGLPSGNSFLTQIQPVMKSELQQAGLKDVTISIVHLPFGSAVEGQYALSATGPTVTQFYISHGGRLYILSLSPASVLPQIENSWHWT